MLVSFVLAGRTGNNIFQYLMCKLLGIYFGHIYVPVEQFPNKTDHNVFIITDENAGEILTNKSIDITTKHILCEGYFQKDYFYLPKRNELLEIFYSPNNMDYWQFRNDQLYVRRLATVRHRIPNLTEDDIVMSVRLDDFCHIDNPTQITNIVSPEYYTNILNGIRFKQLYIVIDKIRQPWEVKYMSNFMKYNPIILQEELLCDIALMRDCNRLIHSNSTLCWIISFLSNKTERYIPVTDFYGAHQCLTKIDNTDNVQNINSLTHSEFGKLR